MFHVRAPLGSEKLGSEIRRGVRVILGAANMRYFMLRACRTIPCTEVWD